MIGAAVTLTRLIHDPVVRTEWPVLARAAATISTPILQNMGTVGGNLLLDTRCNYYDQTYEWRQAIDFCMKKDGAICWVAPSSPRCWAVQSSDLAPVMVALGASGDPRQWPGDPHDSGGRAVPQRWHGLSHQGAG